jgi:CheY-like chemotaxis protein
MGANPAPTTKVVHSVIPSAGLILKPASKHYDRRLQIAVVRPTCLVFILGMHTQACLQFEERAQMNGLRILIADDHEVIRQVVRSVLTKRAGWEVCGEAVDGEDAITKAQCLKPDVIVLDIRMPNLGGFEAARAIKQELPTTLILFLTQHDAAATLPLALQAGGRGLVSKYDMDARLIPAIEELVHD